MNFILLLFLFFETIYGAMTLTSLGGEGVDCAVADFTTAFYLDPSNVCYFRGSAGGFELTPWVACGGTPPVSGNKGSYGSDSSLLYIRSNIAFTWDPAEVALTGSYKYVDGASTRRGCLVASSDSQMYTWASPNSPVVRGGIVEICTVSDDFSHILATSPGGTPLWRFVTSFEIYSEDKAVKFAKFIKPSDEYWVVGIGYDDKIYVIRFDPSQFFSEWKEIPTTGDANGGGYNEMGSGSDGALCLVSNVVSGSGYTLLHAMMFDWTCGGVDAHQANACSRKGICVEQDICQCYSGYYGSGTSNCQDTPITTWSPDDDYFTLLKGNATEPNALGVYECDTDSAIVSARQRHAGAYFGSHNTYIFGGFGTDQVGAIGLLNDVWNFKYVDRKWCWVGGNKTSGQNSVVEGGLPLTFALTNTPSGRAGMGFFSTTFSLLIFGGETNHATLESTNEVWEFRAVGSNQHQWRILHFDDPNTQARPSPRFDSCTAHKSASSDLVYFFGGQFFNVSESYFNDLWNYSIQSNSFERIRESTENETFSFSERYVVENQFAKNTPFLTINPPRRSKCSCWVDDSENFFIFGGEFPNKYSLNDLWMFNRSISSWLFLVGGTSDEDDQLATPASYGYYEFDDLNLPAPRSALIQFLNFGVDDILLYGGRESRTGADYAEMWVWSNSLRQFKFSNGTVGEKNVAGDEDMIGSRSFGVGVSLKNYKVLIIGGSVLS